MVMDNTQLPPIAPAGLANNASNGMPVAPTQMATSPAGTPMVKEVKVLPEKKDVSGLIKTIVIIVLSLVAVTFIGLFIWMTVQYNDVQADVQDQIDVAVAKAQDEQKTKSNAQCNKEKEFPYKNFSGPVDYGELTFQYPKTWSVYVADAAISGGDFHAYFNPEIVNTVSKDTINSLRVTITNKSFEDVTEEYQKAMNKKNSNLTVESITFGDDITGNKYTGTIPNTELSGYIVVFKIRDKTAILQTDAQTEQFTAWFNALLETVTFVK